jgi:hypothetical protein
MRSKFEEFMERIEGVVVAWEGRWSYGKGSQGQDWRVVEEGTGGWREVLAFDLLREEMARVKDRSRDLLFREDTYWDRCRGWVRN